MNAITITIEFTIPRIARAGHRQMQSVCIPVLICSVMLVFGFLTFDAQAQARGRAAMGAAQAKANDKPGSRRVPAKVIPVPSEFDPGTAALVAAPYSKIWNLNPPNAAAWRVVQKRAPDEAVPMLAKTRADLVVSIEATSVGGVRAYILTPQHIPEEHKNQLIFHIHGGGYVFGAGESGTYEAAMIAAYGGYKVLSIDYRMPPDAPYPAALDDVTTAWRAVAATTDPRNIAVEGTLTGGGLALALMLRIKADKLPMPAAVAPGSPWSDMTETGDSY